ncbi:MAG: T9SS type A sorting domain-containing protein [Paludibacteraceae bacterium]|nr:T9SS type A sorting domain-containing protein [Paludibacteraceae bacterium]
MKKHYKTFFLQLGLLIVLLIGSTTAHAVNNLQASGVTGAYSNANGIYAYLGLDGNSNNFWKHTSQNYYIYWNNTYSNWELGSSYTDYEEYILFNENNLPKTTIPYAESGYSIWGGNNDFLFWTLTEVSSLAIPTVSTQAVSGISKTSATGNGNITATGGANITERGIYYSTNNGFANGAGTKVSTTGNWTTTGAFTQEITGLSPGTTYYVKAFATNSAGTGYGSQVSFTTKATPVITWNNPTDITYGTLLSATQLNATANTAGTFSYTPALGTKLNAGNGQTLQVNFTPTDLTNFEATSKTVTINVAKATPVITWSNPENITSGVALSATQLNATADVAGTFIYTPDMGTVLSVGDGQTLKADFNPTDAANYESTSKTVLINVILGTNIPETDKDILVIYPNPTTDNFAIAGMLNDIRITISDLKGLSILNKKISIGEHVDVQTLSKGIYIVQIVSNGKVFTTKLIKK